MATNAEKRLLRSPDDRMLAGVCAGIADFFGLDVSLVRIATLVLILFGGLSIWVYVLLWIIVPKAPKRLNP
ncbi:MULTISPECIES: PspC domain-containing protein [unclassified Alistipes]|uniref:PspC domain-containing protein n=1 Tax=unclassified Alistipes TaxID=2608932 RepID=UPI0007A7F660|nr:MULTISPECIES: PspC domain-containing protein [unclassified Alistipes]CVI65428.1 DNA-binding transcriptional activator PspC [Alistipes sp. CHKCI003]HJC77127.1 PspC domain-containing protein [Candidatus Alistipes excrementavium]